MSLPERNLPSAAMRRRVVLAALVLSGLLSACTVKPLYSEGPALGNPAGAEAALSSVSIKPVDNRPAQEVRNHLIFLLGGGKGQPANPAYTVTLNVTATPTVAALIQRSEEDEPTAATLTLVAGYAINNSKTGEIVKVGTRRITSSYDVPRQAFASLRAQRDAENRAARELAELLRLAFVHDLTQAARQGPAS